MERMKPSSCRKRPKYSDGKQNIQSVDRLSELPDAVLCHILSFLSTKLSVSTSILARRWRFLWTHVPNLDFDENCHHKWQKEGPSFPDIIDKVMLLHHGQNLTTFRLSYLGKKKDLKYYEVETWLSTAISRKVQNIDISLPHNIVLPRCLLTCKTLVDLRILGCTLEILLPASVYLPSLKKLYLHALSSKTDKTLSHLISGCPVLEELLIDKIDMGNDLFCAISSRSLKWLTVCKSNFDSRERLEINAPALTYLKIDGCALHISIGTLNSLIEADLCFYDYMVETDNTAYSNFVFQFVEKVCNVKELTLLIETSKLLDLAFSTSSIIRFRNLTKLDLSADLQFISMFLQNVDRLQVLYISVCDNKLEYWMEPEAVPACLISCLQTISIFCFGFEENEFRLVRYLLKNAQVLKTMHIFSSSDSGNEENFHGLQRISQFERGSAACQLFVI